MSTSLSLAPYAGPFTRREAGHLLRRTTFGVTRERVDEAVTLGLDGALDRLFAAPAPLAPPVNPYFEDDPNVPVGATWVDALRPASGVNVNAYQAQSLRVWQMRSYVEGGFNLTGRMALFWHNHFGITESGDGRQNYRYYARLHAQALGNFRQLVQDTTVDPAMLRFLDGQTSRRGNPNENYARELLELFTLGKGEQVGPGDYSTYTEADIRAIANKLTGWVQRAPETGAAAVAKFIDNRHDPTPRQLSTRFAEAQLTVEGEEAYKEVVAAVFAHPLAAHHLCRKLYRTFVHYDIDAAVEAGVIAPMAERLREDEFEVAPVLRLLLASEHFFDVRERGALVKSPLDYVADLLYGLPFPKTPTTPGDNPALEAEYRLYFYLYNQLAPMLMDLKAPPSVAGWKAWYQSPQYHRTWINASTLAYRTTLADVIVRRQRRDRGNEYRLELLPFIADFDNPSDPNDLLAELAERLLSEPLEPEQLAALKEVLIPGLPDFEWTVEYNHYLDDPDDEDLRRSVRQKVHDVAYALVTSPEYHLY